MEVAKLVERLERRLAFDVCGKCNGGAIDPIEGGPCTRCKGAGKVTFGGDRLKRWREAVLQEIEAWCLEGKGGDTTGGHVLKR